MFINGLKLIKKSQVLTKEEKSKLIKYGFLEVIVNGYVDIIQLPFKLIGYVFIILQHIFEFIANSFDIIATIIEEFCIMLNNRLPQVNLTRGQAREKVLREIRENKFLKSYKVK